PIRGVLDCLGRLVDSSLVRQAQQAGGEVRFGMLETIREYADERLGESGEADLIRARHREWFLGLVEQVPPELLDPAQVERLEHEQDNIRAAMRWTVAQGQAEAGLRLGLGCWPLWFRRGRHAEGLFWLRQLAELPEARDIPVLRGRALAYAGSCATGGG